MLRSNETDPPLEADASEAPRHSEDARVATGPSAAPNPGDPNPPAPPPTRPAEESNAGFGSFG